MQHLKYQNTYRLPSMPAQKAEPFISQRCFVSGALFLKKRYDFLYRKGAVLKGSTDTADYLPLYLNRFEGWGAEYLHASLINAGTLNRNGSNVKTFASPAAAPLKEAVKIRQWYDCRKRNPQPWPFNLFNELPGCFYFQSCYTKSSLLDDSLYL